MPPRRLKCNEAKPTKVTSTWERSFCSLLYDYMAMTGERGISMLVITTGDLVQVLVGVMYKRHARDKGVLFNCCPFCSVSFRKWLEPHLKKGAKRNE